MLFLYPFYYLLFRKSIDVCTRYLHAPYFSCRSITLSGRAGSHFLLKEVVPKISVEINFRHFVIYSVSFKTGEKFKNRIRDHKRLREIADEVCRENRLSVLEAVPVLILRYIGKFNPIYPVLIKQWGRLL